MYTTVYMTYLTLTENLYILYKLYTFTVIFPSETALLKATAIAIRPSWSE